MRKQILNYFKLLSVIATLSLIGCEDGNQVIDQIFEDTQRGAILRTINVISNELPIGAPDGNFSVELEVQDVENGMLVQDIEVYVGFRDNTEDVGPGTDVNDALFGMVDTSSFAIGQFGLPRFTYTVTLTEMLAFVGRNESDITGGDQFTVRFELVLNDGRRFTDKDNSGQITGVFLNSPFLYTPTVTCDIPSDAFVGMYLIEQTTPFSDGVSFTLSSGTVVELAVGASAAQRVFQTEFYPSFCAGTFRPFSFDLICGNISIQNQDNICNCNDGTDYFTQPDVQETYDINDDSSFLITFTDDAQSDCGPPVQTTYRFTKQ